MFESTTPDHSVHGPTQAVHLGPPSTDGADAESRETAQAQQILRQAYKSTEPVPASVLSAEELGLNALCRPLVARSVERLRKRLRKSLGELQPAAFELETAGGLMVPDLLKRLSDIVTRPLVLEMHAARLTGRLSGETSAERFQSYVELLSSADYAMEIFDEYPALAGRLVECCDRWERFSGELLERLERDFDQLERKFGSNESGLGRLNAVLGESGDLHGGGRRVAIGELTCGTRLVYKPRSLALDGHFQSLLRWLNATAPEFSFRTLEVLTRKDYGWVEYADYADCADDEELEHFYFHVGGLLAVLYALQANDFHYENIIACGPHPVLIDLETLFHPISFDYSLDSRKYSVLEIGILPVETSSATHLNLSALGADPNRVVTAMGWNRVGTDEQRFQERQIGLKRITSRPRQKAAAGLDQGSADALLRGFRRVYRTIAEQKESWISPGGLLDSFADVASRCVLRPTRVYQSLLWNQYHPANSRTDALQTQHLASELAKEIEFRPYLQQILPAECSDLENGDVPIFHGRPGGKDLQDSRGDWLRDFFPRCPLDDVKQRIEGFCEPELDRQEWLIRQALTVLEPDRASKITRIPFETGQDASDQGSWLQLAREIGNFLDAKAIRSGSQVTWVGYHRVGDGFMMGYLPAKLYSGQLGVVWFLAQLAEQTGMDRYKTLARQGLDFFADQQLDRLLQQPGIGAFDGLGGAVYVLGHLDRLWAEVDLSTDINRVLDRLQELVPKDPCLDMVSGAAGCLLALLGLHRTTGSAKALATAIQCGESLLSSIDTRNGEITWTSSLFDNPLTGFSHGLSGIATALAQLSVFWRPEVLQAKIQQLIAFEDAYFDQQRLNWQDLRRPDDGTGAGDGFMWAWCHGAPGIVAGRYAMADLLPDPLRAQVLVKAAQALPSLENHGGSSENNLCHGAFGNLDLLLSVATARRDAEMRERCAGFMAGAVERLLQGRSMSRWLEDQKRLDLMLGISGIGYALLRVNDPATPSVLLLEASAIASQQRSL